MWGIKTGARAPVWCTYLIFSRADGQCFIPPVLVHQAENYTQYLHYNILKDWVVHNTQSGYMDRGGWLKEIMHFKTVCGANKLNPQFFFYDQHNCPKGCLER